MGEAIHVEGDAIWKFEPTQFLHEGSKTIAEIWRAKQSNRGVQDGLQSSLLDFWKSGKNDTSIVQTRKNESRKEGSENGLWNGVSNTAYQPQG